jgi:cell filamentation protein
VFAWLRGENFAAGAAELNAIHLFRDGNGRTHLTFFAMLADQAGRALDLDKLDPDATLEEMIESFSGGE